MAPPGNQAATEKTKWFLRRQWKVSEKRGKQSPAEGRGAGRSMSKVRGRSSREVAPSVPEKARQGADARDPRQWEWVEAEVWTERMLAALGNGVKGG